MEFANRWNKFLFHDAADPRMRDLPLLGNPLQVIVITVAWLYFVLRAGPRYMADKKPMSLKNLLQVINVVQIALNLFLTYEIMDAGWFNGYKFSCQPCDYSTNPDALRIARACYIYFLLKIFDFVDTVIFVLRRKDNQISFLHLYHHVATTFMAWIVANYTPGGLPTSGMVLNTIIHVAMYTYYLLAAMGPQYQKYLWWKRYLTRLQLVQFVIQIATAMDAIARDLFTEKGCDFQPIGFVYMAIPLIGGILVLFLQFYVKEYRTKKSEHKRA